MKEIISWFGRHSVAANLLMLLAFMGGLLGFLNMEREIFPSVDVAGATINFTWEGASAQDVEEQIVVRVEEAIADIDGLQRISSLAFTGGASIDVRARNSVSDTEFLDELKLRIDQINNLPRAAFKPSVIKFEGRDRFMGLAISGDFERTDIQLIADKVRDDIAQLKGGQLALTRGYLRSEISVEVTEHNLRRYRMSIDDVANAIRDSSLNSSGGRVRSQLGDVTLSTRALANTKRQFEEIVIRDSIDQGTVRVKDVASVIDGYVDSRMEATFDDNPAAFILVLQPDQMDIVEYTNTIRGYVDRANDPASNILPTGMRIHIIWDNSQPFKAQMRLLTTSALWGGVLVCLSLVLFLHPSVAVWVTVGIATAFAGAFMMLPILGVSWNILSTFAVLLVIGVVVDDAIVVGESIQQQVENGSHRGADAAVLGTRVVLKPIVFGVLTTSLAFAPWAFLTGPVTMFTQQISFVVIAVLGFSLIECLLILPSHLAKSNLGNRTSTSRSGPISEAQLHIAQSLLWFARHIYLPLLRFSVRMRYSVVTFFLILLVFTFALVGARVVQFGFLPEMESNLLQATIELPEGTPFERVIEVSKQIEQGIVQAGTSIEDRWSKDIARKNGGVPIPVVQGTSIIAEKNVVTVWVNLIEPTDRPIGLNTVSIRSTIRRSIGPIADAESVSFGLDLNSSSASLSYSLGHPDLEHLKEASNFVQTRLAGYESVVRVSDNVTAPADEMEFSLKPGAHALGITLDDVSRQVRQAYFGEEAQRLPRNGEDVRVMVRLSETNRTDLDGIRDFRIRTSDGRELPLLAIVDVKFQTGMDKFARLDRLRSIQVSAEASSLDARNSIRADMELNFWPEFDRVFSDVKRDTTGSLEAQQQFVGELILFGLIAISLMYVFLAVGFQSYSQPLLLLTAIPFAFSGAAIGHLLADYPMAVFSLFGVAAAAGVVINDNLVLIDVINRKRKKGIGAMRALTEAGVSRFRPIILTSITTFVGIFPLITERSTEAQFLKPMVLSLGCAVAFCVVVSLILVPVLYAIGVDANRVYHWAWHGRPYRRCGDPG